MRRRAAPSTERRAICSRKGQCQLERRKREEGEPELTAHFGNPSPPPNPCKLPFAPFAPLALPVVAAAFELELARATELTLAAFVEATAAAAREADATDAVDETDIWESETATGMAVWLAVNVDWWTSAPFRESGRKGEREDIVSEPSSTPL